MKRPGRKALAAATLGLACALSTSITAWADDPSEPVPIAPGEPAPGGTEPTPTPGLLHNVTYRARADGTSRGAVVAYKMDDHNVNSEQPTLLPGQVFEVNTVLSDTKLAGMTLSIEWPYGSNLHCEILVDDQIVAQADQFIAPRVLRVKDDPLYGTIQCGAPLDIPVAGEPVATAPTSPAEPVDAGTPVAGTPVDSGVPVEPVAPEPAAA